jgi:hypothetical protein
MADNGAVPQSTRNVTKVSEVRRTTDGDTAILESLACVLEDETPEIGANSGRNGDRIARSQEFQSATKQCANRRSYALADRMLVHFTLARMPTGVSHVHHLLSHFTLQTAVALVYSYGMLTMIQCPMMMTCS